MLSKIQFSEKFFGTRVLPVHFLFLVSPSFVPFSISVSPFRHGPLNELLLATFYCCAIPLSLANHLGNTNNVQKTAAFIGLCLVSGILVLQLGIDPGREDSQIAETMDVCDLGAL